MIKPINTIRMTIKINVVTGKSSWIRILRISLTKRKVIIVSRLVPSARGRVSSTLTTWSPAVAMANNVIMLNTTTVIINIISAFVTHMVSEWGSSLWATVYVDISRQSVGRLQSDDDDDEAIRVTDLLYVAWVSETAILTRAQIGRSGCRARGEISSSALDDCACPNIGCRSARVLFVFFSVCNENKSDRAKRYAEACRRVDDVRGVVVRKRKPGMGGRLAAVVNGGLRARLIPRRRPTRPTHGDGRSLLPSSTRPNGSCGDQ